MSKKMNRNLSTRSLAITSMMIAITVIMSFTPLGMIRLPFVSITIAHVPAIITAIVFGLKEGIIVAFTFGSCSLFLAMTSSASILDPFFINPLISIFPRVMIPITTYFTYNFLNKALASFKSNLYLPVAISVVIGNLTNTFLVYTMLYLIYAKNIFEKTGKPAVGLIISAISITTILKCIGIVIVSLPIIYALKYKNNKSIKHDVTDIL